MPEDPHPAYRPDIDGLRAIAVLSVVGFHAFPGRFPGGFVGVDIFFVISGFLISSIIMKSLELGTFRFSDFYARRIRRIFPALIIVLVSCLAFGWFALLPDEYEQLGKHVSAGAAFVSNIALWRESGYFDPAAQSKPLLHLWSLGIEEQFYIIWPLLLVVFWKHIGKPVMAIAVLAVLSFAVNVALIIDHPVATFYSPVTRFWELMVGGLLAKVAFRRHDRLLIDKPWIADLCSALGATLVASAIVVLSTNRSFPGWWVLAPTIGASLMIVAGPSAWINRALLSHPITVFFGLISYPLYLWHWPILSFLGILAPDIQSVSELRVSKVLAIMLSVLLAWITYQLIERRIRYLMKPWVLPALIFFSGVTLSLGAIVYSTDGFLSRTQFISDPFKVGDSRMRSATCGAYFGLELTGNDYCVISPNADLDTRLDVLIGDSHANGLFPALELAASKHGRGAAQIGSPGCFPALDVQSFGEHTNDKDRCIKSMSSAFRIATDDPRVERVFIAAQWAYYFSGETFGNVVTARQHLRIQGSNENKIVFKKGLDAALDKLKDTGKEIYFVHQIPELDFHPKDCLRLRPIAFYKPVKTACNVPTSNVLVRQAEYRKLVQQSLLERPAIRSIDPLPLLCDDQVCEVIRDGAILYRNTDHLSVQGGPLFEPMFGSSYQP